MLLPLLILFASQDAPAQAPTVEAPASLDELLEPLREKFELPALAAAVTDLDGLLALGAVGQRRVDEDVAVELDDPWHLGSCTKSFTASWIAIQVEAGTLSWDTTVGEVFSELAESGAMHADWRDVPLEWLLQNRGGAPKGLNADGLWGRLWESEGSPVEQRRTLVEGVLARAPDVPPGTKYVYSNAGFSIAAAMAETVLGEPYEERLRVDLLEPLGMASFGFGAPGTAGEVAAPFGHRVRGGEARPVELGPGDDNPDGIAPAGKLHGTLIDWAKYARWHLAGARDDTELLSAAGFKRLHEPAVGGYAMGWAVSEPAWAGTHVLWHNGSNTMWYCELALLPEEGLALLVATNGGDARARAGSAATLRALRAWVTARPR